MFSGKQIPRITTLPKSLVGGQLLTESAAAFLARYPRVLASATITVGGSLANNDQLKVDISLPALSGGKISKTVVLAGGETATTAAQKIAKAINDDAVIRSYGAYANSAGAVVTLYWPGPVGNLIVLAVSVPVGSGTLTPSGASPTGGSGPIIPIDKVTAYDTSGQLLEMKAGVPVNAGNNIVKSLVANAAPII